MSATTTATYTTEAGETRTTCGQHRTVGYAHQDGAWVCRGCGQAMDLHETTADTVARHAMARITATA